MNTIRVVAMVALVLGFAMGSSFAAEARLDGPVTEEGSIAGADFLIEIPENWNGGLVMFAHGYAIAGSTPAFAPQLVEMAHNLDYAIAMSRYTQQGWAAREGILDTEALRRYFQSKYGKTSPTIIAGRSQGAAITYETIETYPEAYDGALPMCGSGSSAFEFFKERVFDMRLLFDYFFPGLSGSVVEFPHGTATRVKVSQEAKALVDANPEMAERFIKLVDLPDAESIPGVIGFWTEILRELDEKTGGNAFDNMDTMYWGSDNDGKLNREIPRYAGDKASVEYLRQWVTIGAEISDPVLHLHTMVDQLIPASWANRYDNAATLNGTEDLFVQLYVDRVGHCNFTVAEMTEALRQLSAWIAQGERPTSADITRN